MTLQVSRTLPKAVDVPQLEKGVDSFIQEAFTHKMPSLIPFVYSNSSLLKLAAQLKRHGTSGQGSPRTLYQYVIGVHRFTRWKEQSPDELVAECVNRKNEPIARILNLHASTLDHFVGALQDEGLAPGTINNHVKGVKQLYRVNGLRVELPYRLSKKVKFKDRSPTPEELQRLIDLGDLRERVIVSFLGLGGFRPGTLALLEYRHVRKDLEKGVLPVHIHVEAEIVKGHYGDYDTFLGPEAVDYLQLYLDSRRAGDVSRFSSNRAELASPPETINDDSPLIRSGHSNRVVKGITEARIHDIVHDLYVEAGILKDDKQTRRYELRAHSVRKYFRTQLAALGVNNDYINYMMGHVVDTYHDVQMKGVEFLRNIYAASGHSIRPKTQLTQIDMAKRILESLHVRPEELLTRDAQAFPRRTFASPVDRDRHHLEILTEGLRKAVRNDLSTK